MLYNIEKKMYIYMEKHVSAYMETWNISLVRFNYPFWAEHAQTEDTDIDLKEEYDWSVNLFA